MQTKHHIAASSRCSPLSDKDESLSKDSSKRSNSSVCRIFILSRLSSKSRRRRSSSWLFCTLAISHDCDRELRELRARTLFPLVSIDEKWSSHRFRETNFHAFIEKWNSRTQHCLVKNEIFTPFLRNFRVESQKKRFSHKHVFAAGKFTFSFQVQVY